MNVTRWVVAGFTWALCSTAWSEEVRTAEVDPGYRLFQGDRPILQYNTTPTAEAAEHEAYYRRSGYIHPLFSPSGRIVTGDYSPDHKHQHGLFFAWTKSQFRGAPQEFWNEHKRLGKVEYAGGFESAPSDRPPGFTTKHRFISLTQKTGDRPTPVLLETWQVSLPEHSTEAFVIDLTSTQRCGTDDPLTIEKYHYGGMAIRGNNAWVAEGCVMLTSEGDDRLSGNHTRPRWVVMSGEVDGETCGVAVLEHPENFRAPQWVRLHPKMPYFVFGPMIEEAFTIEPGQDYRSRYRYVTFDGAPNLDEIETLWQDFARSRHPKSATEN